MEPKKPVELEFFQFDFSWLTLTDLVHFLVKNVLAKRVITFEKSQNQQPQQNSEFILHPFLGPRAKITILSAQQMSLGKSIFLL